MEPRPHSLRHEIIGLLLVKLIALTALYLAFFGPSTRTHVTAEALSAHLIAEETQ